MTKNKKRPDSEYEIEALSKGLKILEALEGINFEPVSVKKIMERTGFKRHIVEWNLKTFRLNGYAAQNESGQWSVGKRFIRLALAASKRWE